MCLSWYKWSSANWYCCKKEKETLSYNVNSCGTIVDGEIVKCIRSAKCSYILSNELRKRCHERQDILQSHMCSQTKPSETAHDSHVKLCGLSYAELIARPKAYTEWLPTHRARERKDDITSHVKKKNKQILKPKKITTQHIQTVLPKWWILLLLQLTSGLMRILSYMLWLIRTLTSLKCQEEEFARHEKLTKNKQKPHPKELMYNPFVIKWSCMIVSKCHKKGYDFIRSILPIQTQETVKQFRQAASTTNPISQ